MEGSVDIFLYVVLLIIVITLIGLRIYRLHGKGKTPQKRSSKNNNFKRNLSKKDDWIDTDQFVRWRQRMYVSCDEETLDEFMNFLAKYNGGYVKRSHGRIVEQDYLGREKGDLKGIYYHVVVSNKKISPNKKEEFRKYLQMIPGMVLEERPSQRDGRLWNKSRDLNEYKRKAVGNFGEQLVRDTLRQLDREQYIVMQGVLLEQDGVKKEFDHLVIGKSAVFVLETKAFGISGEEKGTDVSKLIVTKDGWKLRKKGYEREIENPTKQLMEEIVFLQNVIRNDQIEVEPILVLANNKLIIEKKVNLEYPLIHLYELNDYIQKYSGKQKINALNRISIENEINRHRIN